VTIIAGAPATRCVYLTNDASLAGFTLTNGVAPVPSEYGYEQSGGGAWCESSRATLVRCVLAGNTAASQGGGAAGGHLEDCVLAELPIGLNGKPLKSRRSRFRRATC